MKIKHTIANLINSWLGNRREGHTTAMMNGALNTPEIVVIAADLNHAENLRREFPGPRYITLSQLEGLIGRTGPVLIDHHAIAQVLIAASRTIAEREDKLRQTRAELLKLADSIKSYLNDEA